MTFVHCGPAGVRERVRAQPARAEQPGQPLDLAHRRGPRLERPEPGVPGRVVPHHAGRHDRPGRDDAPADDPRHQLGDDLLVAEPVLHADHGRAGQGRPRARDRGPRVQRLGGDQAEVARGQVTPVGAGADLGGEVRQPGDPQAAGPDRVHVLGPGVDGPYLDAGHARQVRGVQAPDRAAADDGDADHGTGRPARSSPRGRCPRRRRDRRRRRRARPPPARRRGPAGRRGRRAPAALPAPPAPRPRARPAARSGHRGRRSPQSNRAAAPATACATATPPAGAPSIRSCCTGSPPRSTTATATRTPAAASPRPWRHRRVPGPSRAGPGGPPGERAAMPRLSAGSTARSPKRCSQRFWSSPCCPTYGTPRA